MSDELKAALDNEKSTGKAMSDELRDAMIESLRDAVRLIEHLGGNAWNQKRAIELAEHPAGESVTGDAADRLAYEVARLVLSARLGSRCPAAKAMLDYMGIGNGGTADIHAWIAKYQESYLAEYHADDDEHVTEKWLLSIGFHLRESQLGPGYMPTLFFGKLGIYSEWLVENADWISVRTRGDVRRLCKALGIELND